MKTLKKIIVLFSKRARLKFKKDDSKRTGFIIGESLKQKNNYALLNLLTRSLIVLLITLGTLDGFMSAFNIEYDMVSVFSAIILVNIIIMLSQINPMLRLLLYALIIWKAIEYYSVNADVMRSGINALTNMMYDLVRVKFKLPEVSGFEEIITDRSFTVPTVLISWGILMLVFFWESCGRSMNIILTSIFSFMVPAMGLYFDGEPELLPLICLTSAWLIMASVKFNGKQRFDISAKKQQHIIQWGNSQYIGRLINGKAFIQFAMLIIVFISCMAGFVDAIITQETYNANVPESEIKSDTDIAVRDLMIIGFSKYKNFEIKGSISNGQLGQYSSVSLDYEPDLEITYLPSTFEREYLKTFVGTDYSSSGWETNAGICDLGITNKTAAEAKNAGQPFNKMRIKSVGLSVKTPFLPYYTDISTVPEMKYINDVSFEKKFVQGDEYELIYYREPDVKIDDSGYKDEIYNKYLGVPDENREKITQLCSEQGWEKDDPELEEKIADYFEKNFKYTLKPGLVPWHTDFVNYFLFENKEGLCAHFATAGTLIYRCLGIPARYVEGYALDYPLVMDEQKILEEEDPQNWYNGTSPLSPRPVTVELNDFSAHGWVEIYKDGYGWVPVELTPGADKLDVNDNKKPDEKLSDLVVDYFMFAGKNEGEKQEKIERIKNDTSEMVLYAVIGIVCVLILVAFLKTAKILLKHIKRLIVFSKKNSDSVIAMYGYIMDILLYSKKLNGISHKDMSKALAAYMRSPDIVVQTVEEILYSPEKPGSDVCENTFISLHGALEKILAECGFVEKIRILTKL